MNIVAWDLSLTATGVAWPDGRASVVTSTHKDEARLVDLRDELWETCVLPHSVIEVDLVALEDLPQARAHAVAKLGMLHGVVRTWLHERAMPFAAVPPASLKTYATGKGNASKDDVLLAAVRRLDYPGNSKDEADALWLRALAMDAYGCPVVALPATHRRALVKVAWPTIGVAVAS